MTTFIQHVQNTAGAPGHWPDEFLAWYEPAKWLSEERAAAVFLGQKFLALAAQVAPLTLDEARNLSSMQAGVPWTDDLLQALAECIKLYEQCAAAGIRPFDPSDLTPQQHDAFWEHGELPWHGVAAAPAITSESGNAAPAQASAITPESTPAQQAEPCDRCGTPDACKERGCAAAAELHTHNPEANDSHRLAA